MRVLCAAAFFFCVSASLCAQEPLATDSVAPYKMSFEKADSLLISLSKGRSRKNLSTPASFSSFSSSSSSTADPPVETAPLPAPLPHVADGESPERMRKKANVARDELLIEKEIIRSGAEVDLRSINEGIVLGVGGCKMKDSYLSPEKYGGACLHFMNERMRLTKLADYKISRQNVVNVDLSSAINGAENASFLSAFVDYSLGYHYRFRPDPYFKVLAGVSARGMFGMVYNTRNGNNPMTLYADVDLNVSLVAVYEFRVGNRSLAVRYQVETPFAGVLFCPVYGQSYYEVFTLGNTAEVLNLSSFHNKFALRSYLTLDFPVGSATVRVGYFGAYYATDVHEINRYIVSHNVMVGFVKEFVAFGGREMRRRSLYRSAYY
jgi:hypothetical protein